MKVVKSITFEVEYTDGSKKKAGFIRPKKIKELFSDEGSLGKFLVDLVGGVLIREE